MQHGLDLSYEARDLVAPLRSGLRRMDWRFNAEIIREVTAFGGNDHAMADAMGVSRKRMLVYAAEVPQFAHYLHICLGAARERTPRSWSTTWAWNATEKMIRFAEETEPTPLPQNRGELLIEPMRSKDAIVTKLMVELQAQAGEGVVDLNKLPDTVESTTDPGPAPTHPESAQIPLGMRAEDWKEHAFDVLRVGRGGGDDYSMAAQLGISRNMLLQYARAVPEFNEALMYARTCARAWWGDVARRATLCGGGLNRKMVAAGYAWIMRTDDQGFLYDPGCSG